jgi:hypothetical protein
VTGCAVVLKLQSAALWVEHPALAVVGSATGQQQEHTKTGN